jgi:hypothetical protein
MLYTKEAENMDDYLELGKRLSKVDLIALSDEKQQEKVDLRIGLNILGPDGARKWYEYLRVSRH